MRVSILSLFLIPLAVAIPSQSTPRDLTEAELMEKRNTNEGVYLTNCWVSVPVGVSTPTKFVSFGLVVKLQLTLLTPAQFYSLGDWASEMNYYSNARSGSQNGQLPTDTTTLSSTSRITWEGTQRCGTYSSSGVTFCSQIQAGAASLVSPRAEPNPLGGASPTMLDPM
jgi:hypothetical protein